MCLSAGGGSSHRGVCRVRGAHPGGGLACTLAATLVHCSRADRARRSAGGSLDDQRLKGRADLDVEQFLAVNVAAPHLDDPAVLDVLRGQPDLAGVVVELGWSDPSSADHAGSAAVAALRMAGLRIACDVTEAGRAELDRLQEVRPDLVKIDGHLVKGAHEDPVPSEDEYALFRLGARVTRVDITTTVDYASPIHFSTLRKRGAKKAEKAGVTVRRSDDYASFHAIIRAIVEGKYETQATHSQSELELLARRFPEAITLHTAYLGDEMLAGVLIFETASVAHAQYIGATPHGIELGALDMLFSQLIQQEYAAKRYFDFGISTEQAGRFLNEGLIAQKEGFGGRGVVHKFFELALT